jgi:putative peptidoglycan lipid II flippase
MDDETYDIPEPSADQAEAPPQSMAQAGRQMAIAALIISLFLFLGRIAGYVKDMLIARFFGKSAATDAYYSVYNTIIFNIHTKFESLMRPTFLPEFVRVRDRDGEDRAWGVASGAVVLEALALVVIIAGLEVVAPWLIRVLWPAWTADPRTFDLAVVMLRIMAPSLMFFSLSLMPELLLHSYKRFTLPAVAEAAFRTGVVLAMVAALYLVWRPGSPTAIYAATAGVVAGAVVRLVVQLPGLGARLKGLRLSAFWRDASVRTMVVLMPPIVLSLVFSYLRVLADSLFAVRVGEGVYTCLVFGRKMMDAPGQILPLAVSFVVFPFLSQWAVQGERERLGRTLAGMTRAMAFVFLPATVGLMVLAHPIISLVFEQGQFDQEGVRLAALALYCYAPAIAFIAVEGAINKWYFALKDTATPSYAGIVGAILHIAISWFGTAVLGGSVAALALALTISKSLKVIVLYILIWPRIEGVDLRAQARWALRLALAMATTAVVIWGLAAVSRGALAAWPPPIGGAKVRLVALLAIVGIGGGVWYAGACWLFGVDEVRAVASRLAEKVRRGGAET